MISITPNLNRHNGKALYKQLYSYFVGEILAGRLTEGERLPSKKSLAAHLNISVNTIETAYSLLLQEGYITSRTRSGYYVMKIDAGFVRPYEEKPEPIDEPQTPKYKYDFKTNAVDIDSFPYSTWVKLSKEVMYGSPDLLFAGSSKGDPELRQNIYKHLHELRGVNCSPSQIIIGAGIEYLIMLLTELLGKNNTYAIENPGYQKIDTILKNSMSNVRYIPVDNSGMSIKHLKSTDANVVYVTPSHQFPTGTVMPAGRRMELLAWVNKTSGRYIIEDDYNSEFRFVGGPVPAIQGFDANGRVIYLGTFSRILAPSIRIAYMVLPQDLLCEYEKRFSTYSSTVPRFEQHTLSRFISEGYLGRHINRVKNIYKRRRDTLIDALSKQAKHIKVSGESAGLHLIVTSESLNANDLCRHAEKHKIKIYPLSRYYFTEQNAESNAVILGYAGLKSDEIREAVRLLFN